GGGPPRRARRRRGPRPARRHPAGGRQGPRDRPGGGRHRAPVRRPRGAARGAGRARDARMIGMTLAEVARATGGELTGDPGATVTGTVTLDSRSVSPGDLFVAVAGEGVEGPEFPGAAAAAGAVGALATRPDGALPVVVVADPIAALGRLAPAVPERLAAGGLRTP